MSAATTLTSWARVIRRALDEAGQDSAALFAQAGLDPKALADPDARYPVAATARLWALAVAATGDEAFGLTVARRVTATSFHALGYSLQASATLREAFERCVRYFRVVSDAAQLSFVMEGEVCRIEVALPAQGPRPAMESLDAFAALFVRLCRSLHERALSPLSVALPRPQPRALAVYQQLFRAPLRFDADRVCIVYARAPFEAPLQGANAELARQNDLIAARHLSRLQAADLVARVRALLVEHLPNGEPAQSVIARALHTSERNLQRRLADEGTSYKAVLEATRQTLALSYLADPAYTLGEITYLLGFAEASSFTRAFRRWTGCSPSEHRRRANGH